MEVKLSSMPDMSFPPLFCCAKFVPLQPDEEPIGAGGLSEISILPPGTEIQFGKGLRFLKRCFFFLS